MQIRSSNVNDNATKPANVAGTAVHVEISIGLAKVVLPEYYSKDRQVQGSSGDTKAERQAEKENGRRQAHVA